MSLGDLLILPILIVAIFVALAICLGCVFLAWVAIEVCFKGRRFGDLT